MREPVFTAADILHPGETSELDPYEEQLRQSYHALFTDIIHRESQLRQFTRKEYWNIASFLAGHNGNPLGFALCAALRKNVREVIPFVTHIQTERVVVGHLNEQTGVFDGPPWHPLDDEVLHASYHDHRSSRYWEFSLPERYPHMLVKATMRRGPDYYHVMYRPELPVMIPGVFFPVTLWSSDLPPSVQHPKQAYELHLGTLVQFALEAFPVLCPAYRLPGPESQPGTHLLKLFLRAVYGKPFEVDGTTFHAVDEPEKHHAMPLWARQWMSLWQTLPPGTSIGKAEVLMLLNQFGEVDNSRH